MLTSRSIAHAFVSLPQAVWVSALFPFVDSPIIQSVGFHVRAVTAVTAVTRGGRRRGESSWGCACVL